MNGVALFAGIGGLDLGVNIIYPDSRTVCYVEGEMYCAQLLSKKMRNGELADAPIYSDVKTFSSVAHIFTDKVDFITAGFPCQPFSTAGDRKGTSDDRWLWYDIIEIISIIRPRFLFLENVANIVNDRDAFSTILETLSKIGFNVEWSTLRASDVGANHQRDRIFIFGYDSSNTDDLPQPTNAFNEEQKSRASQSCCTCESREGNATDSDQKRRCEKLSNLRGGKLYPPGETQGYGDATDSNCQRCNESHPSTFSTSSRRQYICSSYVEDYKTSSWWQNQPDVLRVDDGVSFGMDRLRGLGNAVVPLQAATAFYHLIQRGFEE